MTPRADRLAGATRSGVPAEAEAAAETERSDVLLRCLVRVALHFARPVTIADIRNSVPIPDDGMTRDVFLRAAGRLGYVTREVELVPGDLERLPPPYLLFGASERGAVVVVGREGGELEVFDPVEERALRVRPEAVPATRAILIKPNDVMASRPGWRSLIAERVRAVMWELILASAVINLFALISPFFLMTVYNKVIGQKAMDTFVVLVIGMVTMYVFDVILRAIRGYVSSHTGARLDALIGSEVVHHLVHLPFSHFEKTPAGMISERLRQLDTIRAFFTGSMPVTLVDMAFVFVFVGALFFVHWPMGMVVILSFPLFITLSWVVHNKQKELINQNFVAHAAKASALNETVNNALTIKSLGLESEVENRWSRRLALGAWTGFQTNNQGNIVNIIGTLLQQIVSLIIIFLGVQEIIASNLSIGALIAANILATRAVAPVRQVVSAWHQLHEVQAAFARLDDIMEEKMEGQPGETSPVPPLQGDIAFENVTFSFQEDLPPVLHDIDLRIPKGTVIGLVGPSGSGKSTLVRLLQGLYEPNDGRVLIDGTDIRHISPATLRQQIGVVPQDNQLFAGTVRENIAFGMPIKDPTRIVAVSRFVGAHGFIQRLPKGYETVLGERGSGLSAGQRQLICVARALIRNPRIIVLDEASSALDLVAEEYLMRNLRRAARGRTIIIVSHRMSPMAICDRVGLLIDGRIERVGKPADVIAYARTRMTEEQRAGMEDAAMPPAAQ
ncbi:MAG: peptidase domain-containing ABC transporter [Alphaproteobacteria bacterium]